MSELRIVYWNAASLRSKLHLLKLLLKEQNIDIVLIRETHLHPSDSINLPGYHTLRLDDTEDSPRRRRGLLVAVRRSLVHHPLPIMVTRSFQSLGVEIQIDDNTLRVFAVYRPPTSNFSTDDIRKVLDSSTPTLAAGDWNAKHPAWRCFTTCTAGRRLFNDACRSGYEVSGPDEPTQCLSGA